MKPILEFIEIHSSKILIILSLLIFLNTCGNPNKITNKRIDSLKIEIKSLNDELKKRPTFEDFEKSLQIEGLKAEKRMIQATDRKMLDVQRQTAIDKEIKELQEK
jgi:hypothetical protein